MTFTGRALMALLLFSHPGSAQAQPGGAPAQARAPATLLRGGPTDAVVDLSLAAGDYLVLLPHLQYRPRFLAHGGRDFQPGKSFDAFSHRARLGLEAQLLTWYSVYLEVQDVRTWGEETNTLSDYSANGLDLHQAWAEARCPRGGSLRIGRQELSYDNHRLIGNVDWTDQARSFDGIRLAGRWRWLQAHLFYAHTGESDVYLPDPARPGQAARGSSRDTDLAGLWLRSERWPWLRPSLIALYDYLGPRASHRFTGGLFLDGQPLQGLSYSAEVYLQAGRDGPEATRQDIFAYLVAASLSYTAPLPTQPTLGGWMELVSGDDDPDAGTRKSFDTLFATNHKFYGFMDLFLSVPADTAGRGLLDSGLRLRTTPARGLSAQIDWHHFRFARQHPRGSWVIGNEVDVLVQLAVTRWVSVEGLLAAFFPRPGAGILRGGDQKELLGYVQTDVRF